MPATTIVLEWSNAETGVGPSIAEGSHGCRPNCADFPAAARVSPIRGRFEFSGFSIKICWRSQVLRLIRNHAIVRINPMSPMRLYRIACKAAVFASVRPYHHPISKNDMIPTPSQPINSWIEAMYSLAESYKTGMGVEQNELLAEFWLRTAKAKKDY